MKASQEKILSGIRGGHSASRQRAGFYQFLNSFLLHLQRVLVVAGIIRSQDVVRDYYIMCHRERILDSIQFAWLGEAGSSFRTSGIYTYFTKIFSILGTKDAVQATSTSQPFVCGNIAPNERLGMKNPNGGSNLMTHPTISFGAGDKWSVTAVVNWNGKGAGNVDIFGKSNGSTIRIRYTTNSFGFISANFETNQTPLVTYNTSVLIGKQSILTFTSDGLNKLSVYVNGVFIGFRTCITTFDFSNFIFGRDSYFDGYMSSHIIRSQSLSPQQVKSEYDYLRSIYPEIPSVSIGTQTWATSNCEQVCTPQGNLIQEMQANGNVEKITNAADREFSSDTGFWSKGVGVTIGSNVASFITEVGGYGTLRRSSLLTIYKYYKVTFDLVVNSGNGIQCKFGDSDSSTPTQTTSGTKTLYRIAVGTNLWFTSQPSGNCSIDNVSVQEIGFSGSQELFDGIYAQTVGTAAVKRTAALKAAAMWQSPNNDTALQAVYGKFYNKFAGVLLAEDITAYNAANPTALWGYDVPSRAQLATLSAVGGNAAKMIGTNYWTTANGTNASGLTMLGSGYRKADGTYYDAKASAGLLCKDADYVRRVNDGDDTLDELAITTEGYSLRLIKV